MTVSIMKAATKRPVFISSLNFCHSNYKTFHTFSCLWNCLLEFIMTFIDLKILFLVFEITSWNLSWLLLSYSTFISVNKISCWNSPWLLPILQYFSLYLKLLVGIYHNSKTLNAFIILFLCFEIACWKSSWLLLIL